MKSVLILGSTCKLGVEISKIYSKNNFNLILVARDEKKNLNLKKLLQSQNSNISIKCFTLNILNIEMQKKIFDDINPKPDGIISLIGQTSNFKDFSEEEIKEITKINYTNLVIFLSKFIDHFSKINRGFCIVVTSVAGLRGRSKNFLYGSAKSALISFISGCRSFLSSKKILFMTVIPGFIQNENNKKNFILDLLSVDPKNLSRKIYYAHLKNKEIIYSSLLWQALMFLIKILPENFFKRIKF